MNDCPCCSDRLLRHIRHTGIYWYCPRCRQEMPVLSDEVINPHREFQIRSTLHTILAQEKSTTVKQPASAPSVKYCEASAISSSAIASRNVSVL